MSEPGADISPNQDRAIAALLTSRTIVAAARKADVGERTLRRWLKKDDFQSHLRRARRQAFSRSIGRLQQVAADAISTLGRIMNDEKASPATRVSAARTVLQFGYHGVEVDDFEQRLAELERIKRLIEKAKKQHLP